MAESELSEAEKKKQRALVKAKQTKTLKSLAQQIPDSWADDEDGKMSLVRSIHTDILGKDKSGNPRSLQDLRYFLFQASQRSLNPFKNQIHAVYIWDSTIKGEKLVPVTGIDGFTSIAQRTGRFAGFGETRFGEKNDDGFPECAIVDMYAYNPKTGARELVTTATAWWDEYVKLVDELATDEEGKKIWDGKGYKKTGQKVVNSTWKNRPKGQLEKCAQALAIRRMFPDEVGGMYIYQEVEHLQPTDDQVSNGEEEQRNRINEQINARRGKVVQDVQEGEVVNKESSDTGRDGEPSPSTTETPEPSKQ